MRSYPGILEWHGAVLVAAGLLLWPDHQYNLDVSDSVYVEISNTRDFSSGVTVLTGGPIQTGGSGGLRMTGK